MTWCRRLAVVVLTGGCLFAGPCGITTLQLRDFITSAIIRTGVSTAASIVEAVLIGEAQMPAADNGG